MDGDVSEGKALKCQHCKDTFALTNNIITKQKFSNTTEYHKQIWLCPDCETHSNVLLNLDETPAAVSRASTPAEGPAAASLPPDTMPMPCGADKMTCVIVTPNNGASASSNGAPENNASGNAVLQDTVKSPKLIGTSTSAAIKTEPQQSSTPELATPDTKGGEEPVAPGLDGDNIGSLQSLELKRPRIEAPSTSSPGRRGKYRRKVTPNLVVRKPRPIQSVVPTLPAIPDEPEDKESPKEEESEMPAAVINWDQPERMILEPPFFPTKEE